MNIKDLNRDQLEELKQKYYDEKLQEKENRTISCGELANIDSLVTDDEVFQEYEGIDFVTDDFFCTAGKQTIEELETEAKEEIDYNLSELARITSEPPCNDDVLELHQLCNGLEQIASDLRMATENLENAKNEGV